MLMRGSASRWIIAVATVAALSAHAASTAELLDKADAAIRDLEYGDAVKALELAKKEVSNTREQMVRLYELQSLALATLGKEQPAMKAFQSLLSLDPEYKLKGKQPPRVTTAYFEARSWIDSKRPLAGRQAGASFAPGVVKEVKVELTNDPLKLVKEVRFHLVLDGKPRDVDVPVTTTVTVSAPVEAPRVSWWAEGLGEKKAVLLKLGDAASAKSEVAPDAPKVEPKPELKPAPTLTETKKPDDEPMKAWAEPEPPPTPMKPLRIAGLAAAGGGVVAAGLGVAFGAMANGTAAKITGAEKDAAGRITSLTRVDALALDQQQRTQATLANVLLVSGGVLVAGGAALFFLGGSSSSEPSVALVPALNGVGLTGSF